jgi:DNA-binding CsgD family transcriptional regulator
MVSDKGFVPRPDELRRLGELLSRVSRGIGGVFLVVGEQGIGKSALLRAGLSDAAAWCRVAWCAADELGQRFSLRLMAECLGEDGRRAVEAGVGGGVTDAAGNTGDLLVGPLFPADPVVAGVERLLAVVERWCAVSPVVLVAEDLQWADDASLLVWQRLSRVVGRLPLVLVGSCRPVPAREEVGRLRRGVAARGGTVVSLGPLLPGQVSELAVGVLGAPAGPQLAGLLSRAGGNPLFVRELVGALVRDDQVLVDGGVAELASESAAARVPVSLVAAIGERLGALPGQVVGVLRRAAVLGQEFSVTDLALVTGWSAGELMGVVEQAVAAEVVAEVGPRLGFRHGLIRQSLYEGIPPHVRVELHLRVAKALAASGAAPERVVAKLAEVPEPVSAEPEAAGDWVGEWLAAALPLVAYRVPEATAELLRRVLGRLPESDARREVLEAGLATVACLLGLDEEVDRTVRRVLARTRDPDRRAEMVWLLGHSLARSGRAGEAAAVVEEALGRRGTSEVWVARLRALHALTLAVASGRAGWATEVAGEALAEAERAGDRLAAGYALHVLAVLGHRRGGLAAVPSRVDRALDVIGDDPQTTDLQLLLLSNRARAMEDLGRQEEAGATIRAALDLAERTGTPWLGTICCAAAEHHFVAGQWDEALAELETASALPGPDYIQTLRHGLVALIAGHRDDRALAAEHLVAVRDEAISTASQRAKAHYLFLARALAAERAGRPGEAMAVLARCLEPGAAEEMPDRYLMLPVLVRVALAAGDSGVAAAAAQAAAAETDREPLTAKTAAAGHCRGLVDGNAVPVLAAAALYHSAGRPFDRAQALEEAAVLLAADGDLLAAREAFDEAVNLYRALGAAQDLRRADARLRRHRIRRVRLGPSAKPGQRWAALTPTETKIAHLVADGRSNPDIAAMLFLSRNTVQTHVSHILAKLGARSRADIIREVVEQRAPTDIEHPRGALPARAVG